VTTASPAPASADLAIDLRAVSKTYKGRIRALQDVSMKVGRGEVFGLLGPNGAGKSTLVKILMTIVRTRHCEGAMLGRPVGDKRTLGRVGYLPEHLRFPDYLTGAQVLEFVGGLTQTPRAERRRRSGELLDLVGMTQWAKTPVRKYSKGMKQRIGVAQALINDPDVVLLDEPTDGVDPVGRRDIREILTRMREQGRAVVLNSHMLGEVEMVCDRVAILVQGTVRAEGALDELGAAQQHYEIVTAVSDDEGGRRAISETIESISAPWGDGQAPAGWDESRNLDGVALRLSGSTAHLLTLDPAPVQKVIDALRARSLVISNVRPVRPSLEDLFIQAVEDPETGKAHEPGADRKRKKKAKA
jgi:ABC-2 type transport system ATP-binding protein